MPDAALKRAFDTRWLRDIADVTGPASERRDRPWNPPGRTAAGGFGQQLIDLGPRHRRVIDDVVNPRRYAERGDQRRRRVLDPDEGLKGVARPHCRRQPRFAADSMS